METSPKIYADIKLIALQRTKFRLIEVLQSFMEMS